MRDDGDKPPRQVRPQTIKRAAQRLARRQRVHRLVSAMFEGSTLNGMAASENISPRRANELFDILGIPRPRLARHRALLAHVRDVDLKVLDELAAEAGISRSEVATRILLAVLSSGKRSAARILGKLAR